ncbi:MAG TPA: hypothetical protein VKB84_14275 [Candidatus Binataceae bacterium]|jgi:hypothetical protein|nr:hypothetical protein [Candidatus Binataceae bacterium]
MKEMRPGQFHLSSFCQSVLRFNLAKPIGATADEADIFTPQPARWITKVTEINEDVNILVRKNLIELLKYCEKALRYKN